MVEQLSVGTVKAAVTEISRQTMDDVQMLKARLHALNTRVGLDRRDSSELLWSAVFAQSSVYELKRPVIGIDLGSTNSSVSIMEGKTSCVISKAWRRQAVVNSANTVFVFKRLIGRQFDDKEVKDDRKHCRSRISMVLGKIAEQYLNKKVKDAQWQSTKDASQIAGLDVFRVINEPMAAAFAYGLDKNSKAKMVAVYDLMISAEMHDGVYEVKSTNGDTHLGGEDFDILLVDHLVKQFKAENSINLNGDRMAIQRIREAAKKAKIELSSTTAIEAKVFQRERELVSDNKLLDNFNLVGIPPAPKGVPSTLTLVCLFSLSITMATLTNFFDGIINISAKDKANGKDQSMAITFLSGPAVCPDVRQAPLLLYQICSAWRRVAIAIPRLWTCLMLNLGRGGTWRDFLAAWLGCSANCLIVISFMGDHHGGVCQYFNKHVIQIIRS
ncbi:Hsp70 protein-domain-containing protein [Mycena pura]|uniref:Hsp70 protein-domain-containing protein n=1 Tax=Mycena pura TaxID=153505 RepID=A0AAD6YM84_9AGAR|nr:Hsp70 protein-domain-containing protein [Mycena pura]